MQSLARAYTTGRTSHAIVREIALGKPRLLVYGQQWLGFKIGVRWRVMIYCFGQVQWKPDLNL